MACNCKKTITNFLGGDVPNKTTFLNCAEADGTHKNPITRGKVQCVAENNVLSIYDVLQIEGTLNNSGTIYMTRPYTTTTTQGLPITLLEV
jgi:hypothetical protein|tara:strand:+ start:70 stop:342 length:273 start_codon:yes stop_codon:yes gene_type:complete